MSNTARDGLTECGEGAASSIAVRSPGVRPCTEFPMTHATHRFRLRSRPQAGGEVMRDRTPTDRVRRIAPEPRQESASPNRRFPDTNPTMATSITHVPREFVALRRATVTYSDARKPVFHAVTPFCRIALCSTEPGVKSGWAEPPANQVTCPECLRRLARQHNLRRRARQRCR